LASWRGTGANCVGLALCLPGRCFASVTAARCGDARAKPPCPRPFLSATASMRF